MNLDFHTHSRVSGGEYWPQELYEVAAEERKFHEGIIVITDSDTMSHYSMIRKINVRKGIHVLPGVEFTCAHNNIETHILGYNITESVLMQRLIAKINHEKLSYFTKINKELIKNQINLRGTTDTEKILRGRLGELLVERNMVNSEVEAKHMLLEWGGQRRFIDAVEVIRNIKLCGGIAVLAHPCSSFLNNGYTYDYVKRIITETNIDGIEVYCHSASEQAIERLREIADEKNLLITGGSGFYSSESPCQLGEYKKGRIMEYALCEKFCKLLLERGEKS